MAEEGDLVVVVVVAAAGEEEAAAASGIVGSIDNMQENNGTRHAAGKIKIKSESRGVVAGADFFLIDAYT